MSSTTQKPVIAKYKPYYAELKKDKRYFWCACGRSKNQPYCDGSHKGTGFAPIPYKALKEGEEVLFCGCKHTGEAPFCDGSHNNLLEEYETEDPLSPENRAIPQAAQAAPGRVVLDGGCQVARVDQLPDEGAGVIKVRKLIGAEDGARHQSQFHLWLGPGYSQAMEFPGCQVLLFVKDDSGGLTIGHREFSLEPRSGAFVRPGEAFALTAPTDRALNVYASTFPQFDGPRWLQKLPDCFDANYPDRTIAMDRDKATPMADRFFQVLIDKRQGFDNGAQFIGEIPQSKAVAHRHLYEETLIMVSGEGCLWTDNVKTPVEAGDVIFLPPKQRHSLECTSEDGMLVAGVIFPGDNPSINY
ncbi:MAG: cupin domain-containing protein [Gammaproteobacteria bacterium]|nr:cupin domain-containing protein [Gammaproteobacteria bacterium]